MTARPPTRRYDLDWLRVLAFAGVFVYHCARFFNTDDWHIKNARLSPALDAVMGLFEMWGMPLLFIVSGAGIVYALRPGEAVAFIRQRALRLLAPLALGILLLAPPQIYLQELTHGRFSGGFVEFLPRYLADLPRWNGLFAWSGVHLWYLENLFLTTLAGLPLFAALQRPAGRRFLERIGRLTALPGVIFAGALPALVLLVWIDPFGLYGPAPHPDLARLLMFAPFVLYGFVIFSEPQIQGAIVRRRRAALILAVILPAFTPWITALANPANGPAGPTLALALASLLAWSTLLAILGYGMRYLNSGGRRLAYANEAVLPVYVLHQPIILLIGFLVTPLALPMGVKYLLILATALAVCLGVYEFGVRRVNAMRRLVGLKPLPHTTSRLLPG